MGRFALAKGDATAGRETLLVEVSLSEREPLDTEGANPDHGARYGFKPPRPSRPGHGYFTLNSGRHFDAKVTIESSIPREPEAL